MESDRNPSSSSPAHSFKELSDAQVLRRKLVGYVMLSFPIIGGVLFTAGSVVYWPPLEPTIDPAVGGILFIIGSAMFFITDFCAWYIEPEFNPFSPLTNIGSFRATCSMLGNISFIIGSVYFLPNFQIMVGYHIFIIASIFMFIPQILAIWGVSSLNNFTAPFHCKFVYFKKEVIWMNLCMAAGCVCFFVGTILFKDQSIEANSLYSEGVIMFIVGSILFFLTPVISLRFKKTVHIDPLWEYRQKIHSIFLKSWQTKTVTSRLMPSILDESFRSNNQSREQQNMTKQEDKINNNH